jgi:nucleotide-binding universal stress UspA family protein
MSVVVGYVDRPEGHAAFTRALEEAQLRSLPLHLVSFIELDQPGRPSAAAQQGQYATSAGAQLEQLAERVRATGTPATAHTELLARGDSSFIREFLRITQQVDAQLIVVGLRPRSLVGKFVMGSRAQDVLLQADCPVLAVKAGSDDR